MRTYLLILVLSFVFLPHKSWGMLHIEPYLGYQFYGNLSDDDDSGRDSSIRASNLGGRFGYTFIGLFGGLEFDFGAGDAKRDNSSGKYDADYNDIGLFIGYDVPVTPLRIWITYFFESDLDNENNSTKFDYDGSGFKFGFGFQFFPLVSFNLEFRALSFSELEYTSNGVKTYPSTDAKETAAALTVSFPLKL